MVDVTGVLIIVIAVVFGIIILVFCLLYCLCEKGYFSAKKEIQEINRGPRNKLPGIEISTN